MPGTGPKLMTIFSDAMELSDPGARATYLDQACGQDTDLRRRVEALLIAHDGAGRFLEPDFASLPAMITSNAGQVPQNATLDHTHQSDALSPSLRKTAEYRTTMEAGVVISNRYTLQERIGEGGMGDVWVAKQTEPVKRKVALKLIKTGMDSKAVLQRFEQERQALALMDHPNIAKVFDAGLTLTGQPFFVMELVNGLSMMKFCDELKLSPKARLELFVPICQAVQHAHQKGIVHRDLKPANILVTVVDARPIPKVIDFGVAKATAGKLTDESMSTQFGAVVGTLEYMSPEQAGFSSEDIDTRADIYSLGVILYELLTGLRPIDAKRLRKAALTEMIRIICEEEPAKPSTRLSTNESLPSLAALRHTEPRKLMALLRGELDWVVMKCLEKRRERRYETANALARDVQRYLANEAVEARPPSAGYRLAKFFSRNKGLVIATSLVGLALLAGIVGTTYGLIRAETAGAAEKKRGEAERLAKEDAVVAREIAIAAEKAESGQRAKAEKARDRTRQALDAMTSTVTGNSLAIQKEISPEQKIFLTEVLTYYQEFASDQGDDELSRVRTAEAAYRVGLILQRLGRLAESASGFRQAISGYTSLASGFPNVPAHRHNLATSHDSLGFDLRNLGKGSEARIQHLKAIELLDELVASFPEVVLYRRDLANNHLNLGLLLTSLGNCPEAEEQFRKALAIQEKLMVDFPGVPEFRMNMANQRANLGIVLKDMGNQSQAEEEHRKSLAIDEKLVADFPNAPEYRTLWANHHVDLGLLLSHMRKMPEAEEHFRKALEIEEKLVVEFPALPEYRGSLAIQCANLGNVLKYAGKRLEAEDLYKKALVIEERLVADFPDVPEYRKQLASHHHGLGLVLADMGKGSEAEEHAEKALEIRERLVAQFSEVPDYQIRLGESYCLYGWRLNEAGKPNQSLEWYSKSIRILRATLDRDHRFDWARLILRDGHWGRAIAYDRLRNFDQAILDWNEAIQLSLERDKPDVYASRVTSLAQGGRVTEAVVAAAELTKNSNEYSGEPQHRIHLIDIHTKLGRLLAGFGQSTAAEEQFHEVMAIREKLVADYPANPQYCDDLAMAYLNSGRTWEAVPLLARLSINRTDTELSLKVAALQAWFEENKELDATRHQILAIAKDTNDVQMAERAAKACSIRHTTDTAVQAAALILARRAAESGKTHRYSGYFQMALGMAEYRAGNLAAAEQALLAAEQAIKNHPAITDTSAFFRAMILFQQGKRDEARELVASAAAKMKPLPADELNPLAEGADHDQLIVWLAYKEARALIKIEQSLVELLEQVRDDEVKKFGPGHASTLATMNNLAEAYINGGRTREAVSLYAAMSLANPEDTWVAHAAAVLQAWFELDQELTTSRQRILALANGTTDLVTAERAAKACSIHPSAQKEELDAALTLARRAVELGKTHQFLAYFQMTLGMAEYRAGNFAAADEALHAVAESGKNFPQVMRISAFFRAMSLFKQGRQDEACKIANNAAMNMSPLPTDEMNPLAAKNDSDRIDKLIVWMAFKEAKALIGFDGSPTTAAELENKP